MTFEDDQFQLALKLLKETERDCVGDVGWLKSVTNKVFGADASDVSWDFNHIIFRGIIILMGG